MYNNMLVWLVVIVAVVLLILFGNRPAVTGECDMQCSDRIVGPIDSDSFDKSDCGGGHDICCIKSAHYSVATAGWELTCTCCDCTGDAGLGKCDYQIPGFNWLGAVLGLCTL